MSNEDRQEKREVPQYTNVDDGRERMRQLANVFIQLYVESKGKQPSIPAVLSEVA